MMMQRHFAEFFAGGGMVSKALLPNWNCVFANDFDPKKTAAYRDNHKHSAVLLEEDISKVVSADLTETPALIWGSSPCQDLSVAGKGAGLKGGRSGTYHEFWRVIDELTAEDRAPEVVAIENVVGSLTSNSGNDFSAMCDAFSRRGYVFGAMVIDARDFVPQSRPRLFIVGVRAGNNAVEDLKGAGPKVWLGGRKISLAFENLSKRSKESWIWWDLPKPQMIAKRICEIIQETPKDVVWHSKAQTQSLIAMMSDVNLTKLRAAMGSGRREIGFVYKRTRQNKLGEKVQRAEVRFDGIAGCLRTPGGGSSRQLIVEVKGNVVRSRLLGIREAARLMGLDDSYDLPKSYNEGYHLMGDGVVVPVVEYLDVNLFSKLVTQDQMLMAAE